MMDVPSLMSLSQIPEVHCMLVITVSFSVHVWLCVFNSEVYIVLVYESKKED